MVVAAEDVGNVVRTLPTSFLGGGFEIFSDKVKFGSEPKKKFKI